MLDFDPPANLEVADYSNNQIKRIENADKNKYLKVLILDNNQVEKIEGLGNNRSL
jgi:Leucine-rich repeat (LRR) protein